MKSALWWTQITGIVVVVADNRNPDEAHARKVKYYDTTAVRDWCAEKSGVQARNVWMTACALTWWYPLAKVGQ